jgi:energy-coupling factor transport system ATP-binding protein
MAAISKLRIDSLRYREGGKVVLQGTDMEPAVPSTTLLVGPSGSGKTSLLYTLAGVIPLLSSYSRVKIDGRVDLSIDGKRERLWEGNSRDYFRHAGILFQYPDHNMVGTTVLEEYRILSSLLPPSHDYCHDDLLYSMNIRHLASRRVSDLSEGEKQLVALACVFLRRPHVVFLDEPLTMLDYENRRTFIEWLQAYVASNHDVQVFIATHRPWWYEGISPVVYSFSGGACGFVISSMETIRKEHEEFFVAFRSSPSSKTRLSMIDSYKKAQSKGDSGRKIIECMNLDIYHDRRCRLYSLCQLNFCLRRGDHTTITGPNGSGKTTLALSVCGLHKKMTGQLRVLGEEPSHVNHIAKGSVGMAVQIPSTQIIYGTVKEEIQHSLILNGMEASEIDHCMRYAESGLSEFGIAMDDDPHSLSFGQQKMLALLFHLNYPSILIVDEPCTSLDEMQIRAVKGVLKHYQAHDVTTIILTHDARLYNDVSLYEIRLGKE